MEISSQTYTVFWCASTLAKFGSAATDRFFSSCC
jgi:hypothetical protein